MARCVYVLSLIDEGHGNPVIGVFPTKKRGIARYIIERRAFIDSGAVIDHECDEETHRGHRGNPHLVRRMEARDRAGYAVLSLERWRV